MGAARGGMSGAGSSREKRKPAGGGGAEEQREKHSHVVCSLMTMMTAIINESNEITYDDDGQSLVSYDGL